MVKMNRISTFRKCSLCALKFDDENRERRIRAYMKHKKTCYERVKRDMCGRCGVYEYDWSIADNYGLYVCWFCVEKYDLID